MTNEYNPQTRYYQWVTFIFAIQVDIFLPDVNNSSDPFPHSWQAAVFYMPYKIWATLEGGLMASFGTDARRKVLVSRDSKLEDEDLVLELVADRFVKYFKCVFHRNTWYYAQFICCKFRL